MEKNEYKQIKADLNTLQKLLGKTTIEKITDQQAGEIMAARETLERAAAYVHLDGLRRSLPFAGCIQSVGMVVSWGGCFMGAAYGFDWWYSIIPVHGIFYSAVYCGSACRACIARAFWAGPNPESDQDCLKSVSV